MSKSSQKAGLSKGQLHKQKTDVSSEHKKDRRLFAVVAVLVTLAAIAFALGKYFEFNSPGAFDCGAYVYSAKHILDGAVIGVEEKPSAQLGTLLVNILGVWLCGFNDIGPKLLQALFQAAALVLMFIAVRKLFGSLAAAVSVIIASVYLSSPLIAKYGNVKEQYMIAFMIMGVSCFVLRQLKGRWWWAVLAGVFLSWAPLFKATGVSAVGAVGLFVILQPFLKHRTWKQTGFDILLLLAGAAVAIGPLYIWIIGWDVKMSLPYEFAWNRVMMTLPLGVETKPGVGYLARSRRFVPFSQQWRMVLRYYQLLVLPIALAAGAIIARIIRMIWRLRIENRRAKFDNYYDRFVLLFAVWWLLDMAFVWISPRSYEQYYLPLNASAAMLGGYLVALYTDRLTNSVYKSRWVLVGFVGFICMLAMSWHIFFGIEKSPYSGKEYGRRQRGYAQRFNEVSRRRSDNLKAPWEEVAEYIRLHSEPTDKIYVWGWYPGIYVVAQRLSSASSAFCMPRPAPQKLAEKITTTLAEFEREPPKFIVDSRKRHIPMERPPYELWPIVPKGFMGFPKTSFLPLDKDVIAQYDEQWSAWLSRNFDEDEALRYQVLKPFRDFVMNNYKIVRMFGQHVLFELKKGK
jgi:4-amino-4-deoxy-L-arabinose transferase-like glycosyltransferase